LKRVRKRGIERERGRKRERERERERERKGLKKEREGEIKVDSSNGFMISIFIYLNYLAPSCLLCLGK
jgi:hypothetical protein